MASPTLRDSLHAAARRAKDSAVREWFRRLAADAEPSPVDAQPAGRNNVAVARVQAVPRRRVKGGAA